MSPIPIIIIWAVLLIVVIGYVIYRVSTDKEKDGKKHPLYPLNSNPGDPMFPKPENKIGWVIYLLLLLPVVYVIGMLVNENLL